MKYRNLLILATLFVVSIGISRMSFAGTTAKWVKCAVSGSDYTPGQSKDTYWCCCLDGTAGWGTTACSYPKNVNFCNKGGQNYFADKQLNDCTYTDRGDNVCRSLGSLSTSPPDNCNSPSQCNGVAAGTESTTCSYGSANRIDFCSSSCGVSDGSCESSCPGYTGNAACDEKNPEDVCGTDLTCDEECKCTKCKDPDGGKSYKTAGTCTNGAGVSYQDTCGAGNVLTEYYCSGESCLSTTKDCDDYDNYYCTITNPDLYRKFEDWYCGAGECDYGTSTTNTYKCDLSKNCTTQSCEATSYKCYYSNAGSYEWAASYPATETACADGYDNDCDGLKDSADPDCVACSCTSWTNQGCGAGGCLATQMNQTRTCTPAGCDIATQCVPDPACAGETFTFNIYKGWNLISPPFKTVAAVVSDGCAGSLGVRGGKGADNVEFYWLNENGKWVVDTVGILKLKGGFGYWLYLKEKEDCQITIAGSGDAATSDIVLRPGWNQVGSPKAGMTDTDAMKNRCVYCGDAACSYPVATYEYDTIAGQVNPSLGWKLVTTLEKGKGYRVQCID